MEPTDGDEPTETLFESNLRSLPLLARGKVRDNYAVGEDRILMVASDRISAFDVVMNEPIPGKGRILTEMALFWFAKLAHIVPHHLTGDDPESVVADDEKPIVRGRSMLVRRLKPLPVEAVVRGYLAGSAWKEYQATRSVCGVMLPPGLKNASKLPSPIFTPATKAAMGEHDENIDFGRMSEHVGPDIAAQMRDAAICLYREAADYALTRGIIIADTKFEFGLDEEGTLTLMDEVLTPDSSRYWPVAGYVEGISPRSLDKQTLRDWLEESVQAGKRWNKRPPAPKLPDAQLATSAGNYRRARDLLVSKTLSQRHGVDPTQRIEMRKSPLQTSLETALSEAGSGPRADSLRADLAAQMARTGYCEGAEAILSELRTKYASAPHEVVTPWLNFAEATLDMRLGRGETALLKMQRAHALSSMSALPLAAFAAATLASMYWNRENVDQSLRYAKESLDLANPDDHRTLCRVSMVISEILAISRREDEAEPWFKKTQRHAKVSGDDVAISTLALNMSIIQSSLLRQTLLNGIESEQRSSRAALLTRCSKELDALLSIPKADISIMHSAQLMSLLGRFEEALNIYEKQLAIVRLASASRRQSAWLSDMAWCSTQLNQLGNARDYAQRSEKSLNVEVQMDDRAATHSRLAWVYAELDCIDESNAHKLLADMYWNQYWLHQDDCAALCKPFARYLGDIVGLRSNQLF